MPDLRQVLLDAASLTHLDRTPDEQRALRDAIREVETTVEALVPDHRTTWGVGQGNPAYIPWVSIHPGGEQTLRPDPKSGYYLVYLIAHDGSAVSLTLVVGTYSVQMKSGRIARAIALRTTLPIPKNAVDKPDVEPLGPGPTGYLEGSAYSLNYNIDELPSNDELENDLSAMVERLDAIWEAGLRFNTEGEPLHVFCPWIEELGSGGIVQQRKRIADEYGSAWWTTNRPVSANQLEDLSTQISSGVPTYAYLYAAGDSWRARLLEVTDSAARVSRDQKLLADGHPPEDNRLAMRLSQFEALDRAWRGDGLVVRSNGKLVSDSVANRPAFSFVFSGRPEDHMSINSIIEPAAEPTESKSTVTEDLQELASKSGMSVKFLAEIYDVLNSDMPQVVLAGPPGTGKTWLAKELAAIGNSRDEPYSVVQFHPSYAYEDFIEGLRPELENGQVAFKNARGHLLELVRELPEGGPNTLIIDELNRANIPSVFGELLYLLEYRAETIRLRLTGRFSLPAEMRFIATMNAADRSVRSMDAALRRRFEIFELAPSSTALANYYSSQARLDVPDLLEGFEALNARLTSAIDRHHGIGHSFFMGSHMTGRKLRAAWDRKVRPIIEEYFFDEPHRVDSDFRFDELWPSQAP